MLEFTEVNNGFFINGKEGDDLIVMFKPSTKKMCMIDKNATADQLRQIADKLDVLNGVETKFNPLSIIENKMESLDEERKKFKEIYDRTEAQINQGVRPAGKRFKL